MPNPTMHGCPTTSPSAHSANTTQRPALSHAPVLDPAAIPGTTDLYIIIIITGYMYLPTTLSIQWMRTYMFPQFEMLYLLEMRYYVPPD